MYESYLDKVDSALDFMSKKRKILYIKGIYPDILRELLRKQDGAEKLREWLGITSVGTFDEAKNQGLCCNLRDIYRKQGQNEIDKLTKEIKTAAFKQIPTLSKENNTFSYVLQTGRFGTQNTKEYLKVTVALKGNNAAGGSQKDSQEMYVLGEKNEYKCTVQWLESCDLPDDPFFYLNEASAIPEATLTDMLQVFLEWGNDHPNAKLVLTGSTNCIPNALADYVQVVDLGVPTYVDIRNEMEQRLIEEDAKKQCPFDASQLKNFARQMCGLTCIQIDSVYESVSYIPLEKALKNGTFEKQIWNQKENENAKTGLMQFQKVDKFPGVVGCGAFSRWLNARLPDLVNPQEAKKMGIRPPRGVILAGVPGSGKTQLAKQMTYLWAHYDEKTRTIQEKEQQPASMIVFRLGDLTAKHLGESQEKMRQFLDRLSVQDKVVLFVDEVEKHMFQDTGNRTMHETMKQMMSMFLDWLQEHQENVFTFMTSNDISILPPELIRTGRISERFFVHMPNDAELMSMLYVFLRKSLLNANETPIASPKFAEKIREKCTVIDEYTMQYGTKGDEEDKALEKKLEDAMRDGILHGILDKLADYGKENNRTPFMTGSDMEKLVEDVCVRLRMEGALKDCKEETFAKTMEQCCCNERFVPYGQSNMQNIVQLFLSCDYVNISAKPLVPRHSFDLRTGRFSRDKDGNIQGTNPQTNYDRYLQEILAEEIEKGARRKNLEQKRDAYEADNWEADCALRDARRELEQKQIEEQAETWGEECALRRARRELERKQVQRETENWEKDTSLRNKQREYDTRRLERELKNWNADTALQDRQKELQDQQTRFQYAQMVAQYNQLNFIPENMDDLQKKRGKGRQKK